MGGQELAQATAHVRQADRIDRRHREPRGHGFVQRTDLALQIVVPLHDHAAAFVKPLAFGRQTNGRFERSMSCTPMRSSSWWTTWLAFDCDTPLALAAREKLPRSTMSQKILRNRRCIWHSVRAIGVRSTNRPTSAADASDSPWRSNGWLSIARSTVRFRADSRADEKRTKPPCNQ